MESFLYVVRSIVALVVVIWLANVVLKYLNKYSNHATKSIQIVERISVSKTSSLAIVKIVGDYYLMSFSEQSSETLRQFTTEEAEEIEAKLALQEAIDPVNRAKEFDVQRFKSFKMKDIKAKYKHLFEQK